MRETRRPDSDFVLAKDSAKAKVTKLREYASSQIYRTNGELFNIRGSKPRQMLKQHSMLAIR